VICPSRYVLLLFSPSLSFWVCVTGTHAIGCFHPTRQEEESWGGLFLSLFFSGRGGRKRRRLPLFLNHCGGTVHTRPFFIQNGLRIQSPGVSSCEEITSLKINAEVKRRWSGTFHWSIHMPLMSSLSFYVIAPFSFILSNSSFLSNNSIPHVSHLPLFF